MLKKGSSGRRGKANDTGRQAIKKTVGGREKTGEGKKAWGHKLYKGVVNRSERKRTVESGG